MDCRKNCLIACGCINLTISTIFAAAIGILFFFNYIPSIVTAIWISFGLGVLSLILLFVGLLGASANPCRILSRCLCARGGCLLVGSIGTIVSALTALAIVLNPSWILTVILVAIGAFFTAMMLVALFSILMCFVCAQCGHK
jgi:hypothetical protein